MPWKKSGAMEQRTEFALRAMQTLNFRALCQQYGISTKTGYKWRERFWRKGLAGMEEESRRPKSHSKQLAEEEVCEIVRLKLAHLAWGPRKIRELYLRRHGEVASESTFKRVLERTSLTQKRRRRRAPEAGRLSSGRQAAALNEVWTVDFKGWWRKAEQRCEPLTVRDEYSRSWRCVRWKMPAAKRCAKVLSGSLSVTACPKQSAAITARPLTVGRECLA